MRDDDLSVRRQYDVGQQYTYGLMVVESLQMVYSFNHDPS